MKTEIVQCATCGNSFEKLSKEVKRSLQLGRNQYCSRACSKKSSQNLEMLNQIRPGAAHLDPSNRRDEYTGFRQHLLRAKRRTREINITLEDLKQTWEEQRGICPYSKVQLRFVSKTGRNNPIYAMSLDRKDSSLGYVKGNIQFISIAMNLMKNSMSEEEMQELLMILKIS
jgi:hypothetical protein